MPNHTHFVAAMDAMRRGKHVYVEKPLTHSFREAELLMQAEKRFGVVTQMGNQGHTSAGSSQFAHLVEKGIIRDITRIDAWQAGGLWFMNPANRISDYPPAQPMPETLDGDLWCGPAERKPFNKRCHNFGWMKGCEQCAERVCTNPVPAVLDLRVSDLRISVPPWFRTSTLSRGRSLMNLPVNGYKNPSRHKTARNGALTMHRWSIPHRRCLTSVLPVSESPCLRGSSLSFQGRPARRSPIRRLHIIRIGDSESEIKIGDGRWQ